MRAEDSAVSGGSSATPAGYAPLSTLGALQPAPPGPLGPEAVPVNGKVFTGNPRDVPLTKHAEIQLEVGTPLVAPESISWANTGL